jgi:hypothetical protein
LTSAEYEGNLQISIVFLCTSNDQLEKEIRKTIQFTGASKRMTYLEINLTKSVQDLYPEAGCQYLMPVILATQEAEIRRFRV